MKNRCGSGSPRWVKASDIACYSMNFSYLLSEIVELLQEVKKCSWTGIRLEAWDVYSCVFELLYHRFGLNLPVLNNPSIESWARRWGWWKIWLCAHNLSFHPSYMRFGSNFRRREKRHRVLQMAKEEQT